MPGRETHTYVGVAAGIGYAAFQAKEQSPANLMVEAAGGALGGWCGGRLPDAFEPGTSSWHRSLAHSGTTGTAIVAMRGKLTEWEKFCRPWQELRWKAEELFWRLAAGFANGLAAGYVSHLALDAGTPRSIPLLVGGF